MIEGQEKVGTVGFDMLDQIEKHYGEDSESAQHPDYRPPVIHQVMTVAEVEYTDAEGDRSTHVIHDYSEPRPIVRHGLVVNLARASGVIA